MKKKTTREALNEVREALRDLTYNFLKSIGIIWLIKKMPLLVLISQIIIIVILIICISMFLILVIKRLG